MGVHVSYGHSPKGSGKIICYELKKGIRQTIRDLCKYNGIEVEANMKPDQIHLLLSTPPKHSVPQIMGYLKEKSETTLFKRDTNWKYKEIAA